MTGKMKNWLIKRTESIGVILVACTILRLELALLRVFNTWLLPQAGVPFVSLANVRRIILHSPGVILGVLLEIGGLCYSLTLLLALLMVGVVAIEQNWSWASFKIRLMAAWRSQNWATTLLLLADLVVLAPLFSIAFRSPLLTMIRVPEVMLDYGSRNGWLATLTIGLFIICACLLIGSWQFWKLVNLRSLSPKKAWQLSWSSHPNRGKFIGIFFCDGMISWLINCGLAVLLQSLAPNNQAFSITCLVIAEMAAFLLCSDVLIKWVMLLANDQMVDEAPSSHGWLVVWPLLALVGLTVSTIMQSYHYFQPTRLQAPVTISHKGVADDDGVQNTVQALQRTSSRYHPDYVEIDIHETKDRQFVVMHDDNLRKLTGIDRRPGQLTLHQLTRLTAHEHGYRASVDSFDDYLTHAKRLHQKLIVELKTTRDDSPDMVKLFSQRYGNLIVQRHYLVHSLDYDLVRRLQYYNPQMKILYLQAYNFTNPLTTVKGFNNEYSSLNQRFIDAAHQQRQPVYAWTVNSRGEMQQLVNERVDGIVTDRLPELQRMIRQTIRHQSDVERYWNYLNPVANFPI